MCKLYSVAIVLKTFPALGALKSRGTAAVAQICCSPSKYLTEQETEMRLCDLHVHVLLLWTPFIPLLPVLNWVLDFTDQRLGSSGGLTSHLDKGGIARCLQTASSLAKFSGGTHNQETHSVSVIWDLF